MNLPNLELKNFTINPSALDKLESSLCISKTIIPIDLIGNILTVVVPYKDQYNREGLPNLRKELSELSGCCVQLIGSQLEEIKYYLNVYYLENYV